MKLISQNYGKARVRVAKVIREGAVHSIKELTVRVALQGDFEASYSAADNTKVVPTDTCKNTVNVLAYKHLGRDNEAFAITIADHFLNRYAHVGTVTVEIEERLWTRMIFDGQPHPHSFTQSQRHKPFVKLVKSTDSQVLESGVSEFIVLKSTGSGFEDFHLCENTTLPPTTDRILATSMRASWRWGSAPASYTDSVDRLLQAIVVPFAHNYSASVQATLWEMAQVALDTVPEISQVTFALPNLHFINQNLAPFGIDNQNVLFLPTDEPHGQIEATLARD